jgi:hypothetical protein
LLDEFAARIQAGHTPFPAPATNGWVEAQFNPQRLAAALGRHWPPLEGLAQVSFSAGGDGATVLEQARLDFARPLDLKLEPWKLPSPLVAGQVTSFTAVRGFGPWLASLEAWKGLEIGGPPNQAYCWALHGVPLLSFFAAPGPDASNQVARLSDLVLRKCGPWLATNPVAKFRKAKDYNGLEWRGLPYIDPFLQSIGSGTNSFVFAGLFPPPGTNASQPLPPDLVAQLEKRADLVGYSWEITARRVNEWVRIGQFLRLVAQGAQMPPLSAAFTWLAAAGTNLWPSVTEIAQTGAGQLSFKRRSSLGFTAVELHLLADWLESKDFPFGLHTTTASPSEPTPEPAPTRPPARPPPAKNKRPGVRSFPGQSK